MRSPASSSVMADQAVMHTALDSTGIDWKTPRARTWRSLLDIAMDWTIICLTVWIAYRVGAWAGIAAIFVIGNRQRALGNLLHEGGHQNLSNSRDVNDRIACFLLAPPLFNELTLYRLQHAWHHGSLGDPVHDPDYLSSVTHAGDQWFTAYLRVLTTPSIWAGSMFGHFISRRLALRQKLVIVLWWAACEALFDVAVGPHFALLFIALWIAARATVFHAITTFREMTDHYGLEPGGIFSYTRDIPDHGLSSVLLHPHHNGYHLTHHLFPHIPYLDLPEFHVHLKQISAFSQHAIICDFYVKGGRASVTKWGATHV
ncbi:fatty acid desaturase [Burkholderia cepacia]|nr:fatty acid desaturase [Burkholderia cepacia]